MIRDSFRRIPKPTRGEVTSTNNDKMLCSSTRVERTQGYG